MEVWKEVLGFDVLYEVSNMGRVRTRYDSKLGYTREFHFVQPRNNEKGYMAFNWRQNKKQRTVYLHRLVAEAFIPNPLKLAEINHKDENKANNVVDNLEWCSHVYNCNYGTRNERSSQKNRKRVLCIETGIVYNSAKHAADAIGISKSAIYNCIKGYSSKSGGFSWRYADVYS